MRRVHLRVDAADLGQTFSHMREWLDREDCIPVDFDQVGDQTGAVVIEAVFDDDELAEAFRREFNSAQSRKRYACTRLGAAVALYRMRGAGCGFRGERGEPGRLLQNSSPFLRSGVLRRYSIRGPYEPRSSIRPHHFGPALGLGRH
jgi:hypothetical protein